MHGEEKDYQEVLTPSYHGELCRHNGENPDYEIACDECDYYLMCFPDWKAHLPGGTFLSKINYRNPPARPRGRTENRNASSHLHSVLKIHLYFYVILT